MKNYMTQILPRIILILIEHKIRIMIKMQPQSTTHITQMKKFVFLLKFISILVLFIGCKRMSDFPISSTSKKLDQIEAHMFQYPENLDSLLSEIDTTNITPNEQARIRTIRCLSQSYKGEFEKGIPELEKAEKVFLSQKDDYHSHINKLIRAFTFEYLRLDNYASDLYVECEGYFGKNHLEIFRFYSSLGILRMSKHLLLDEKVLIDRIRKDAEQFNVPLYEGLLFTAMGQIEKNDSLRLIYYERAKTIFILAHRWPIVYQIELNTLFTRLEQKPTEITQAFYDSFPNYKYFYTPTPFQQLEYKYAQAYLYGKQGNNKKAIEVANKVLKEAVESKIIQEESDCVHLLAYLYKRISDYKNANNMLERYHMLKEKKMSELQKNRLLALGAHYRYAELEREKLDLKVKVQKSFLILGAVSLVLIVIVFVSWFLIKNSRHKQAILKLENIEIEDQIINLLHSLDKQENRNAELISQVEKLEIQYNDSSRISEFLQAIEKEKITSWLEYEAIFISLRPGWIEGLKQKESGLTSADLRYCMCIYSKLSNKIIADLLNITPEAIKSAKKRIRDKFSLDDASEIYFYLKKYE
jgi:DNA-binding CsgD family transcriptional regulator